LDECFPGWEKRINITTLDLSDPDSCICGQVFAKKVTEKSRNNDIFSGFQYASKTLFSEANSWITSIVGIRSEGSGKPLSDHEKCTRVERVATALGFNSGWLDGVGTGALSDEEIVEFEYLQEAWTDLLAKRAAAKATA
jgi:hypothetical protein